MKNLSKDEMKMVIGGVQQRVACMECGGSIGTLCEAAPAGGACIADDFYMVIQCTDNIEGATLLTVIARISEIKLKKQAGYWLLN